MGILPEFKDRACYDLNVTSGVIVFDPTINSSGTGLKPIAETKILNYDPACSFRGLFPYSKVISEITEENPAIRSIDFDVDISASFSNITYRDTTVTRNLYASFATTVVPNSLFTDTFFIDTALNEPENIGKLVDDGNGFILFVGANSGTVFNYRLGTIDYTTGNITIIGFDQWDPSKAVADGNTKDLTIHVVPVTKSVKAVKQATFKLGTIGTLRLSQ